MFKTSVKTSSGYSTLLTQSGNVGIGTTSLTQALNLVGTMQIQQTLGSQKGCIQFNNANGDLEYSNDCSTYQSLGATAGGWTDQGTYTRLTTTLANVGIGLATAPLAKLQIVGTGTGTGLSFLTQDSAGTNRFAILDNGNVGIGTTVPLQKLQIGTGGITMEAPQTAWLTNKDYGIIYSSANVAGTYPFNANDHLIIQARTSAQQDIIFATGVGASTTPSVAMVIKGNGNVGIGTTSPAGVLQIANTASGWYPNVPDLIIGNGTLVSGAKTQLVIYRSADTNGYVGIQGNIAGIGPANLVLNGATGGNIGIGTTNPGEKLEVNGDIKLSNTANSYIKGNGGILIDIDSNNDQTDRVFVVGNNGNPAANQLFRIEESGNVGINTTTPGYKLDVNGAINATSILVNGTPIGVGTSNYWTANGSSIYYNSGSVGIGTASPSHLLSVGTDLNTGVTGNAVVIGNPSGHSAFSLGQDTTHNAAFYWMYNATAANAYLTINTYGYTNPVRIDGSILALQAQSGGNVGIGTTNPTELMHVYKNLNGSLRLRVENPGTGNACAQVDVKNDAAGRGIMIICNSTADTNTFAAYANRAGFISDSANGIGISANTAAGDIRFYTAGIANANEKMRITSSGNVGIGTTNPTSKLQVESAIFTALTLPALGANGVGLSVLNVGGQYGLLAGVQGSGNAFLQAQRVDGTPTAYNLLLQPSGGSVGIGTTNPGAKLEVAGSILASGGSDQIWIKDTGVGAKTAKIDVATVGGQSVLRFGEKYVSDLVNINLVSGNVGIGTTSPNTPLEVKGIIRSTYTDGSTYVNYGVNQVDAYAGGVGSPLYLNYTGGGNIYTGAGKVGIGTVNPAYKLDVNGAINATSLLVNGTPIGVGTSNYWTASGSNIYYSAGSVGIGTAAPGYNLEVVGQIGITDTGANRYAGITTTSLNSSMLIASYTDDYSAVAEYAGKNVIQSGGTAHFVISAADANSEFQVYTGGRASGNRRLTITSGGNVGIGTTAPAYLVDAIQANATETGLRIKNTTVGTGAFAGLIVANDQTNGSVDFFSSGFTTSGSAIANGLRLYSAGAGGVSIAAGHGSGKINFFTGGTATPNMVIDTAGNIGIGTTAPAYKLDVNGAINATSLLVNGSPLTSQWTTSGSNIGYLTGNIGIGTTTPAQAFHLIGQMEVQQTYGDSTKGCIKYNSATLQLQWSNDCVAYQSFSAPSAGGWTYDSINNYVRLTTSSSNVGIGTTNPLFKLDVAGNIGPSANDTYDLGSDTARWANIYLGPETLHIGTSTSDEGYLSYTTSSNVLNLQSTGNISLQPTGGSVGIGTTNPGAKLHIQETNSGNAWLRVTNTANGTDLKNWQLATQSDGRLDFQAPNDAWNALSSTPLTLLHNGNVGIGTTNPLAKLDILGTFRTITNTSRVAAEIQNNYNNSGQGTGQQEINLLIDGSTSDGGYGTNSQYGIKVIPTFTGNYGGSTGYGLYVNPTFTDGQAPGFGTKWSAYIVGNGYLSTAAWTYGSDIRLKENIASVDSGLDKIMQLKPVSFDYINGVKSNLGFIAQDVQLVIPEAVSVVDPNTGMLGLKTDFIIPYLVKGIQEQQVEINNLIASQASSSGILAGLKVDSDGVLQTSTIKTDKIILSSLNTSGSLDSFGPSGSNEVDLAVFLSAQETKVLGIEAQVASQSAVIADLSSVIASDSAAISAHQSALDSLRDTIASISSQIVTTLSESSSRSASSSSTPRNDIVLNLTPPEILLATGSAQLVDLSVSSEATFSGKLKSYGDTFLGNTLIAGDFSIDGTLSLTGSSINSIGILNIQNSPLSQNLDILNGAFIFTKDGILTVSGTVVASQFAVKVGTSTGIGTITAGQIDTIIENSYVDENSVILITPHTSLSQTIAVADKVKGGFLVKLSHTESSDITFDYLIVGVK